MRSLTVSVSILTAFFIIPCDSWFWGFGPNCESTSGKPVGKCPSGYKHPKCSCNFNDDTCLSRFDCKDISDTKELQDAFRFNWGKTNFFDTFWLEDSKLTSLPDGIFNGASFKNFYMLNSTIPNIGDNGFKDSENTAIKIDVYDSDATGFNFKSIRNLKKLESLFIGKSHVNVQVPADTFRNLVFLESIYLRNNEISDILPDTFNNLPKLRYLDVAENKLTKIKNGALNLAPVKDKRGVSVDLDTNQISSIESNVFAGLSTPGYISIQDNNLTDLPEEVFKPLLDTMVKQNAKNTKVWFNVRGNPMDCSKNVDWIKKVPDFREKAGGYRCADGSRPIEDYEGA